MTKKEEFKEFAKGHPELVKYIRNKEMTWQDFYEIYDLYGTDEGAWKNYIGGETKEGEVETAAGIGELTKLVKNINMDNIQKHINTAQKAINVIQELTSKTPPTAASNIISKAPRPLTKFFND